MEEKLKAYQAWLTWALEKPEPTLELNRDDLIWFKSLIDAEIARQSVTDEAEIARHTQECIDHEKALIKIAEMYKATPTDDAVREAIADLETRKKYYDKFIKLTREGSSHHINLPSCEALVKSHGLAIQALRQMQQPTDEAVNKKAAELGMYLATHMDESFKPVPDMINSLCDSIRQMQQPPDEVVRDLVTQLEQQFDCYRIESDGDLYEYNFSEKQLRTVITALRQMQPVEPCEWCRYYCAGEMIAEKLVNGYETELLQDVKFCPSCGRKLKDGDA
jgi:hypothetical protein